MTAEPHTTPTPDFTDAVMAGAKVCAEAWFGKALTEAEWSDIENDKGAKRRKDEWCRAFARGLEAMLPEVLNRFLAYPLPADFRPDGGISYVRPNYASEMVWQPSGTNLFSATQADAMLRYVLSLPAPRNTGEV